VLDMTPFLDLDGALASGEDLTPEPTPPERGFGIGGAPVPLADAKTVLAQGDQDGPARTEVLGQADPWGL
jgi:hypothetical protein